MPFVIESLTSYHDRDAFDCGEPVLNEYLRRYARQNQERGIGRTYVAMRDGEVRVVGFYMLAAGSVLFDEVPEPLRRRMPHYPIPVVHLGRLATCLSVRAQHLGAILLFDALQRTVRVAAQMGIAAVEVRAKSQEVRNFYAKYGFASLLDDSLHMYMPIATIRSLIG